MSGAGHRPSTRLPALLDAATEAFQARRPARSRVTGGRLGVIAFHRVTDPAQFAVLLDALHGRATPVTIEAVVAAQTGGPALPDGAVLLTFDDGHPTVLDHALPAMRARGVPGVVFVVAGLVDTDTPFWWDEVIGLVAAGGEVSGGPVESGRALANRLKEGPDAARLAAIDELRATASGPAPTTRQLTTDDLRALEDGGIAIGSHSLTHPILARCDDAKIQDEVAGSRELLTRLVGRAPSSIAYPSGRVDDRVVEAVRAAGYPVGFAWHHDVARIPAADPFRIPRMHCDAGASRSRFVLLAQGRHRSAPA